LPLGVILLTFILSIPKELGEESFLDGCGYLRHLMWIIVPLAWPSIVITCLYSLLAIWNDIIGPVVLLTSPSLFSPYSGRLHVLQQQSECLPAAGGKDDHRELPGYDAVRRCVAAAPPVHHWVVKISEANCREWRPRGGRA
jgi:hypothetical protein